MKLPGSPLDVICCSQTCSENNLCILMPLGELKHPCENKTNLLLSAHSPVQVSPFAYRYSPQPCLWSCTQSPLRTKGEKQYETWFISLCDTVAICNIIIQALEKEKKAVVLLGFLTIPYSKVESLALFSSVCSSPHVLMLLPDLLLHFSIIICLRYHFLLPLRTHNNPVLSLNGVMHYSCIR